MIEMKLLVFLSIFSFILPQQCILGTNCPLNQGVCVGTRCECLEGYRTFYDKTKPINQQVFCNYQQIDHYHPLILEVFYLDLVTFMLENIFLELLNYY